MIAAPAERAVASPLAPLRRTVNAEARRYTKALDKLDERATDLAAVVAQAIAAGAQEQDIKSWLIGVPRADDIPAELLQGPKTNPTQ